MEMTLALRLGSDLFEASSGSTQISSEGLRKARSLSAPNDFGLRERAELVSHREELPRAEFRGAACGDMAVLMPGLRIGLALASPPSSGGCCCSRALLSPAAGAASTAPAPEPSGLLPRRCSRAAIKSSGTSITRCQQGPAGMVARVPIVPAAAATAAAVEAAATMLLPPRPTSRPALPLPLPNAEVTPTSVSISSSSSSPSIKNSRSSTCSGSPLRAPPHSALTGIGVVAQGIGSAGQAGATAGEAVRPLH